MGLQTFYPPQYGLSSVQPAMAEPAGAAAAPAYQFQAPMDVFVRQGQNTQPSSLIVQPRSSLAQPGAIGTSPLAQSVPVAPFTNPPVVIPLAVQALSPAGQLPEAIQPAPGSAAAVQNTPGMHNVADKIQNNFYYNIQMPGAGQPTGDSASASAGKSSDSFLNPSGSSTDAKSASTPPKGAAPAAGDLPPSGRGESSNPGSQPAGPQDPATLAGQPGQMPGPAGPPPADPAAAMPGQPPGAGPLPRPEELGGGAAKPADGAQKGTSGKSAPVFNAQTIRDLNQRLKSMNPLVQSEAALDLFKILSENPGIANDPVYKPYIDAFAKTILDDPSPLVRHPMLMAMELGYYTSPPDPVVSRLQDLVGKQGLFNIEPGVIQGLMGNLAPPTPPPSSAPLAPGRQLDVTSTPGQSPPDVKRPKSAGGQLDVVR